MRNEMTPLPILLAAKFSHWQMFFQNIFCYNFSRPATTNLFFFFFSYSQSRFDSWVVKRQIALQLFSITMFQNVFAALLNVVKNTRGLQLLFQKLNRLKYKTKQLEQNY